MPCSKTQHGLTRVGIERKMGFTGVYIIFLFLLQNIECGYTLEPPHYLIEAVLTCTTINFLSKIKKNITLFRLKIIFLQP